MHTRLIRGDKMKREHDPSIPRIGVDYSRIESRAIVDSRYERDNNKKAINPTSSSSSAAMSSTFDALIRLQAGVEARTLSEKITDSNRPTW
jgi:hypothetical protein